MDKILYYYVLLVDGDALLHTMFVNNINILMKLKYIFLKEIDMLQQLYQLYSDTIESKWE